MDLEKLSSRELEALIRAAEERKILLLKRRPVAIVRAELIALAASYGFTIAELIAPPPLHKSVDTRSKRRKLGKVAVKYRDPESKINTWSGRGSMPRWLVEKKGRGQSVADFLVPGIARPTAKKNSAIGQKTVFKRGV